MFSVIAFEIYRHKVFFCFGYASGDKMNRANSWFIIVLVVGSRLCVSDWVFVWFRFFGHLFCSAALHRCQNILSSERTRGYFNQCKKNVLLKIPFCLFAMSSSSSRQLSIPCIPSYFICWRLLERLCACACAYVIFVKRRLTFDLRDYNHLNFTTAVTLRICYSSRTLFTHKKWSQPFFVPSADVGE